MPRKCSYFMCEIKKGKKSMFRFPIGDPQRLQVWLDNCGNVSLTHLSAEVLHNKLICINHFDSKFIKYDGKRSVLSKSAVPMHYRSDEQQQLHSPGPSTSKTPESPDLKVLTPKKVYGVPEKRAVSEDEGDENDINCTPKKRRKIEDTPKCKKLKESIKNKNVLLRKERRRNTIIKKKIKNKQLIDINSFKNETSKMFAMMQLKINKTQWTETEKKFCMSLFYKSPSAYKHLRKTGIVLAAPSTIQRWLQETNCLPGFNNDILENVSLKFADRTIKDKSCSICFDEMSIKIDLDYTKKFDLIEGFEDFGGGDRSPKEAKYALVFVARGIYSNWKIPLAYFLSEKNVNADKLIGLIKLVIKKLFGCGLLPKVIVCDQASTNVKAIKSLGVTKDDPYFFVDNHKLYSIFDVPHLIKNIRNNLIDSNFDFNGSEISFNDIIALYNLEKNKKSKSVRKLTPVHLKPNNFQKMRVKLATQVFSKSVADSIKTAIHSGELKNDTAIHTADFVQCVNDLFDSLNSNNKFNQNPFKCALTKNKETQVYQSLIKGKSLFANLKRKSILKNNQIKFTCPPCFEGIQQSINAVLQFSTEEFSKGTDVKFIMTYRLNQDVIENLFGIYRMRGGCNRNPTSKNLRAIFRSNLLNNLIKLESSNCEIDNDYFVSTTVNQQNTQTSEASCSYPPSNSGYRNDADAAGPSNADDTCESSHLSSVLVVSTEQQTVTLEICSVMYFAGWLAKNCVEKFDCLMCKQELINDEVNLSDEKQLLLINKTYSNLITPTLKSPTDFLYNIVDRCLDLFNSRLEGMHRADLVSNLINEVNDIIDMPDYHDTTHLDYLIRKLFEVKIHDYCKSRKSSFDSRSKLKVLQHK